MSAAWSSSAATRPVADDADVVFVEVDGLAQR